MAISMGQLASLFAQAASKLHKVTEDELELFSWVATGLVKTAINEYDAIDTGVMLNSTKPEKVDDLTYLIGPTVGYAAYVALGTSRVAARPFHTKAAEQLAGQMKAYGISPKELGF